MNLNTLTEVLKHYARFYRHEMDELALAVWAEALKSKEIWDIKQAFLEYSKASMRRVMPMPAEILKQIDDLAAARIPHQKPTYRDDPELMRQYDDAVRMAASKDMEQSKVGWAQMQRLRTVMARDYLRHMNGLHYVIPPSMKGSAA